MRADIRGTPVSTGLTVLCATRGGLEISKSKPGEVCDMEGQVGSSYEGLVGGQVGRDKRLLTQQSCEEHV